MSGNIFQYADIVENILKNTSALESVNFRAVNKTFNWACLRKFRREYRHLKIEENPDKTVVSVNGRPFPIGFGLWKLWKSGKFIRFLRFLSETAHVECHSIELVDGWDVRIDKEQLHEEIVRLARNSGDQLKVFTGMEGICSGECNDCLEIALKCREYGPIDMRVLLKAFPMYRRHYDTLIVSESLLCAIARKSIYNSESKMECFETMQKMITGRISCDRLVFQLNEKPFIRGTTFNSKTSKFEPDKNIPLTQSLPREIIDAMIWKWRVKSVKLEFKFKVREPVFSDVWSRMDYFTEFRFDWFQAPQPSGFHLDSLEIDLTRSFVIPRQMLGVRPFQEVFAYQYLFGNAQRIFPSSRTFVSLESQFKFNKIGMNLGRLLNSLWLDDPWNSEVQVRIVSMICPKSKLQDSRLPGQFRGNHICVNVADSEDEKFICKKYSFTNNHKSSVRVQVLLNPDDFSKALGRTDFSKFSGIPTHFMPFRDPYYRSSVEKAVEVMKCIWDCHKDTIRRSWMILFSHYFPHFFAYYLRSTGHFDHLRNETVGEPPELVPMITDMYFNQSLINSTCYL